MTTSGTYSAADFTVAQTIDEGFRRCKFDVSLLTGEHIISAKISLEMIFIDWINDGVQQFIIDRQVQNLVGDGTDISFVTPSGTIDVLDMIFRNGTATDIQILAINRNDYLDINQKTTSGQPITYFTDKTSLPPTVFLWPVQNITGTSVVYNRLRQIQDVGASTNTLDTTITYKEAVCACLADVLWIKYGDDTQYPGHGDKLSLRAKIAYERAKDQDRDRARLVIRPRLGRRFAEGV